VKVRPSASGDRVRPRWQPTDLQVNGDSRLGGPHGIAQRQREGRARAVALRTSDQG
jgi:hypothetical protein